MSRGLSHDPFFIRQVMEQECAMHSHKVIPVALTADAGDERRTEKEGEAMRAQVLHPRPQGAWDSRPAQDPEARLLQVTL